MITLFFAPGASSMAPHIALHEIGEPFESWPISFARKENRAAKFLAINPEGKVPTLLIDGAPLTEVAAILYYLARRFPKAALLPEDIEGQAQAISWMSFIASTIHPARRLGIGRCLEVYALAEQKLGRRPWILERYSIADIHLFRLFWRFVASLRPDPGAFPNLMAHYAAMLARPAVVRTLEVEAAVGYELPA